MNQPSYLMGATKEYVGKEFGLLTITEVLPRDENRHVRVRCRCQCGRSIDMLLQGLTRGTRTDCGCVRMGMSMDKIHAQALLQNHHLDSRRSMVGTAYGRLTVTEVFIDDTKKCKCRCECGKELVSYIGNLKNGHTKSCGCLMVYRHPERNVGLRKLYYRYTFRDRHYHGREMSLTLEEFRRLTSSDCHYCGRSPGAAIKSRSKHSEYTFNGLDRVDSSKGYESDNVVPCCEICNTMKMDMGVEAFREHVRRIYAHWAQSGGNG